jgi:hypothetical protein
MSMLTNVTSVAVGRIWKVAAMGILATSLASTAYLGYEWHSTAGERDTAVSERLRAEGARDKALSDNGELRGAIANQNRSVLELANKSVAAQESTAAALTAFGPIKASINALAARLSTLKPSVTCEQALTKQRQAIDGLRGAK